MEEALKSVAADDVDRWYRSLLWMVFFGSLLVYFWGIWSVPVLTHNEARRMVAVREMLESHNWLVPTKNGIIYVEKPPLFYWVAALFGILLQSTSEVVARLPSAMAGFAMTWFVFLRVREYVGQWAALLSALFLVTSKYFVDSARVGEIDLFFSLLCALSVFFYLDFLKKDERRFLYMAYTFLGLAVFTKGPVALVFFLPPILLFARIQKDLTVLRGLCFFQGWLVFLLIAVPWYAYIFFFSKGDHLENVIARDITRKTFDFSHMDGPHFYFFELFYAFSPWILIFAYRFKTRLRQVWATYEGQYFGCAFLVPLFIMSLVSIKHGKYILPIYAPLAAFLGIAASQVYRELRERWRDRFSSWFVRAAGLFLALLIIYVTVLEPRFLSYRYEQLKPLVAKIKAVQGLAPVYLAREYIQLIYYYGKPMPVVDRERLNAMIAQHESFLLVAQSTEWAALEDMKLCTLQEFSPFLHTDRSARLLASNDFCEDRREQ